MNKTVLTWVPIAMLAAVLGLGILTLQSKAVADDATAVSEKPIKQSDPMQFVNGAKTWANTCARCHNMRDPKSLRDDQWRAAMAHMRVRAHLTEKEAEDVLVFLQQSN